MTVGRHGRLTYRKGTMDLSKLLYDQLVPRSAGAREAMLVTGKSGTKFASNGLILASIRKRTSAGQTAGPRSVTPGQDYVVGTGPSTCRKMTFLELCVAKQATSIFSTGGWSAARCLYGQSFRNIEFKLKNGRLPPEDASSSNTHKSLREQSSTLFRSSRFGYKDFGKQL